MTTITNGETGASVRTKLNAALAKADQITVTQPVDLDAIEARVNGLDAAVILKGAWSAAGGQFPGAGAAQAGESWIVSAAGVVGGVDFALNDRIVALTDNASTATYSGNWLKLDYTDQVLSVAGLTGAIAKAALLGALNVEDGATNDLTPTEIVAAITANLGNANWQKGGEETLVVAVSDEATALTVGAAKVTFRSPWPMTLSGVRASLNTAPVGSVLQVDVNVNGVSIFSTALTIDAAEKSSVTAAVPAVLATTIIPDDAEITIDIDTVGSTTAGKGLKVVLLGRRT